MIKVRKNKKINLDTTKDDENSKNDLGDNSNEIRNSKNIHQFITKKNERIIYLNLITSKLYSTTCKLQVSNNICVLAGEFKLVFELT